MLKEKIIARTKQYMPLAFLIESQQDFEWHQAYQNFQLQKDNKDNISINKV